MPGRSRSLGVAAVLLAFGLPLHSAPLLRTADGAFLVFSSDDQVVHRAAVLAMAQAVRSELTGPMAFPRDDASPLEIELGPPDGRSAVSAYVRRDGRGVYGCVRVPDATAATPDALRFALTTAFVRAAVYRRAAAGKTPREPPAWWLRGLAAHTERDRRAADFEAAHALWSRGRLPVAQELFAFDSAAAAEHPVVAAQFVAWCTSRDRARPRTEDWLAHLGAGGAWAASDLARCWAESDDLTALDEDWDLWLEARTRRVLEAGATFPGTVRRFRAQLLLFPWEYDMPLARKSLVGVSLRELAGAPMSPRRRTELAMGKAAALRSYAAGRDPELRRVADLYGVALASLAAGAGEVRWQHDWEAAEAARLALEARGAAGEVLRAGAR